MIVAARRGDSVGSEESPISPAPACHLARLLSCTTPRHRLNGPKCCGFIGWAGRSRCRSRGRALLKQIACGFIRFRYIEPISTIGMEWLDPTGFSPQWTAPFMPNTCFAFHRTDQSFHGVLPHDNLGVRNVLLLNVFRKVDADHREVQAA